MQKAIPAITNNTIITIAIVSPSEVVLTKLAVIVAVCPFCNPVIFTKLVWSLSTENPIE